MPASRVYLILATGTALAFSTRGTLSAIYRIEEAGLNPLQLVLVGTVLEASVFLFEIPTGVVADAISRRRSVIIGVFIVGAGFILEGSIPLFATILLAQVVWGLGYTFTSGAEEAWIADELGDDAATTRAFLKATQLGQLAALAGIVAAVALASITLALPLIAGGVGMVAIAIFLLLRMPENNFNATPREERETWVALRSTLQRAWSYVRGRRAIVAIFGATLLVGAFSETFDRLWEALLLDSFQFPTFVGWSRLVWFGVIDAAALILSAIATAVVVRRLDDARRDVIPGLVIGMTAALMFAVVGLGLAGEFFLAVGLYQTAVLLRVVHAPLVKAWLNRGLEKQTRATVFSMWGQADAVGQVAGGPALGLVATAGSLRAAFVTAGIVLFPAALLYAWAARRRT